MRPTVDQIADPSRNALYATGAVAITVYAFSYSVFLGSGLLVAFLAAWMVPIVLKPAAFRIALADLVILGLPILALLSTFWSAHPEVTLRASLQYLATTLCAAIAAQIVAPVTLARGLVVGSAVTVGHSLIFVAVGGADGTAVFPGADTDTRLTGLFGSPNQLGLVAAVGLVAVVALNLAYRQPPTWKLSSAAVAAMLAATLAMTDSVTSMVALAAAAASAAALVVVRRRSHAFRTMLMPWIVAAAAAALALGAAILPAINVYELVGRDESLSGRTDLWAVGWEVFQRHATLGTGFQAFWVVGNADAERLWDAFVIPEKGGFHFHNLFIQVLVDLGIVGLIVLAVTLGTLLLRMALPLFQRRVSRRVAIYIPFVVFFLVRTTSEIDFFGQFSLGTFLMTYVAVQSARLPRSARRSLRAEGSPLTLNPFERPLLGVPGETAGKRRRTADRRTRPAPAGGPPGASGRRLRPSRPDAPKPPTPPDLLPGDDPLPRPLD